MSTPLSEVLSLEADNVIIDEDQTAPETETDTTQETIEATETVETVETATETTEAAPTAEPEQSSPEIKGIMSAMMDERSKRQALEAQIKTMQTEQVEKPDAFVNPDEAINYAASEVKTDARNDFLNLSESNARRYYSDFDTMKDVFFEEIAAKNPAIAQQAANAPDPFEFIYQQAKNFNEFKGIENVGDYKAKIEAEMRTKLEAEYSQKSADATEQAINNALPNSLSTATATGGNQTPTWAGRTSLSNILGK